MELPEFCPDCGKQLSKTRKKCACGWRIAVVNTNLQQTNGLCGFITPDGVCTKLGSISPQGMCGRYLCRQHWYEAMYKKSN